MRTHAEIISSAESGEIAQLCDVSVHTVRSWGQRGSIPAEHWPKLVLAEVATLPELAAGVKPRLRRVA